MAEFPTDGYVTPAELEDALAGAGTGGGDSGGGVTRVVSPLGVPLSSFGGANDDERFALYEDARRDEDSAVHGWPVLLDQPRVYTVERPLPITSGFAVVGSVRGADQPRGSKPIANQLNLRTDGGWLELPDGKTFGVALVGLAIDASAQSPLVEVNEAAVLWCSIMRDVSYQNGPGIMGRASTKQPNDAWTVEGWCNWNNITDRAIHIGGSDSAIHPTKLLIDSPPSFMGPKHYLVEFSAQTKTDVSGFYLTAEQHSGIRCRYSNRFLSFSRMHVEGRNAGVPCYGALVRLETDYSQWTTSWFAYGMTNPAAGPSPDDAGLIHCAEGHHEITACHTERATGVSEDVPFVFGTGADTHVVVKQITGVGYSGKPVVKVTNGATADCDDTVRLIEA